MFDADKTRMIELQCGEKTMTMLSRFHLIPERHGQKDGQTDRIAISISRVSVLTSDKNQRGLRHTQLKKYYPFATSQLVIL